MSLPVLPNGTFHECLEINLRTSDSAGGCAMTASDVVAWDEGVRAKLLVPDPLAKVMFEPSRSPIGNPVGDSNLEEAWRHADEISIDRSLGTKIRGEMLRSFICCQSEQYRNSAQTIIDALRLIGKHCDDYLEERFHAVQNLALLGRELSFDEAAEVARRVR